MIFMQTSYFITIIVLILSCNPQSENTRLTKYKNIVTKYTEIKQIVSKEVDDTFYVYIRMPKNYFESNERYPVLYLLDGDISFNMATSVVRYLQFGKSIPDLIIVAPAYGTMLNDNEQNFRERDYTVSQIDRFEGSGGGKNYLRFINKELIPLIDSSYRTNGERLLNGYSLGGLFVINTLLFSPQTFDYFIAGSPYIISDLKLLLDQASIISFNNEKHRLFISVGELEDKNQYQIPIKTLAEQLEKIAGLETKFIVFENGSHFTCPSEALTYGLKFIFDNR